MERADPHASLAHIVTNVDIAEAVRQAQVARAERTYGAEPTAGKEVIAPVDYPR
jgi:hypothetical protein